MAATDVTLCGTPCLVIGFGRIGKLLATVCGLGRGGHGQRTAAGRSRVDRRLRLPRSSHEPVSPDGSGASASSSTPCRTWYSQRNCCAICRCECVLLELASQSGFDRAAAEARGLKCIAAPGLPGRAAPETAARAIKLTLEKIWEEEA